MIVQKLLGQGFEVGYNAMYDRVEDLIDAGVLDPAKVTRSGLTNACSIAGIMLTTQVRMRENVQGFNVRQFAMPRGAWEGMQRAVGGGRAVPCGHMAVCAWRRLPLPNHSSNNNHPTHPSCCRR